MAQVENIVPSLPVAQSWKPSCVQILCDDEETDEPCKVYIPSTCDVPCEWSLKDVTAWLWTSKEPTKRVEKFMKYWNQIRSTYKELFGTEAPEFRPTAYDAKSTKPTDQQESLMYEKTIATNVVFAFVVFGLAFPEFDSEMRVRLGTAFHNLIHMLIQSRGVLQTLSVRILGGYGRLTLQSSIIDAKDVWPPEVCHTFSRKWQEAAESGTRQWLNTTPNSMPISSFVVFSLDLSFVQTASCLLSAGIDLVQQLANLATPAVVTTFSDPVNLKRRKMVGSLGSVQKGAKVAACFRACEQVRLNKEL